MNPRPLRRTLFAASALLGSSVLSGCFARIVGIEQFTPTSVATDHPHELVPMGALSPAAIAFRLTGQAAGEAFVEVCGGTIMLRADRRETGLHAGGLIVPFLPLFGAFAEPKDWDLVINVYYHGHLSIEPSSVKVRFDGAESESGVVEFQRQLDVWPPLHSTPTPMGERLQSKWTKLELAFGVTYAEEGSFELELPVAGAATEREVVRVKFERRRGSYWDTGFYGGPTRLLARRRMKARAQSAP